MKTIDEMLEVMQAFKDGKDIECKSVLKNEWFPAIKPLWNWMDCDYRVKPEKHKEEHKTGKWLHGRELGREYIGSALVGIYYEDWRCSECRTLVVNDGVQKILWKYCPWCGAKMEE